jgi:hypothetical protein
MRETTVMRASPARRLVGIAAACGFIAVGACKQKEPGGGGGGSAAAAAIGPEKCPPGYVVKDGACTVVVTAEKVAAVAKEQSRIDELAALLDKVDTVGAPVELLAGFRQLEPWQALVKKSEQIQIFDAAIGTLDQAVKQLRAFQGELGQASARIGDLRGELDKLLQDTGAAKRIEDVRAQVSTQLRAAVEPLAAQVTTTIESALNPLTTRLEEGAMLIGSACLLSGGGEKVKELCGKSKDLFGAANRYLADLRARPATLFTEVTTKLEAELDSLVDTQSKQLIAAAQAKVQQALKLPAAAGSGSAAPAGSAAP